MRTFLDEQNQKWELNLTWDVAEQINSRVERHNSTPENPKYFDLLNLSDHEQAECFVLFDPLTGRFDLEKARCLVRILYILCEEQCDSRNISPEEFAALVQGGTFSRAKKALEEEIVNFIPDEDQKKMYQNLLCLADGNRSTALSEMNQILTEKLAALTALQTQNAQGVLSEMFATVEKEIAKAAEGFGTTSSSKSAGRSGSLLAERSRSGNSSSCGKATKKKSGTK